MNSPRLHLLFLFMLRVAFAQESALLPIEQRTNGAATLDALSMVQSTVKRSVAQVLNDKHEPVQLAIVMSEDGYMLTKASEVPDQKQLTLAWFDGVQSHADVLVVDTSLDLLLARAARSDLVPITWSDARDWPLGTWTCAFNQGKPKSPSLLLRLGNLSAQRRLIAFGGAALGVAMDTDSTAKGARIIGFGAESPAQLAGLRQDDVIVAINDVRVASTNDVHTELDRRQPGDRVKVSLRRGKNGKDIEVRLASKSKIVSNWTGEDYANGGVSLRTDNFPEVLQHQMPLSPRDMGGPLLDLEGKALGINIARVDRVTTFALPMKVFWGKVQQWIVQARNTTAEEVRSAEVVGEVK